MNINYQKVGEVFDSMIDDGTIEDRREYDRDMLIKMYDLNKDEANVLYQIIEEMFQPEMMAMDLTNMNAEYIKEYLLESIHGGWEGFDSGAQIAFMLMIGDLKRAVLDGRVGKK
jgi:hypothetical protein